jgi:UDP-N-acetylmuramoyl-L-alanyl-D-glutamate--2,6-diaminopimelate ligase
MPKFAFSLNQAQLFTVLEAFNLPSVALVEQCAIADSYGDLVNDTRKVKTGDVFCAVIGSQQNGNDYIAQAVEQGASLIIAQCKNAEQHGKVIYLPVVGSKQKIPQIFFYQLNVALFSFAQAYYQNPQQQMTIVGITGTNGKTSTSQIIAKLLACCQEKTAVIGTNGAGQIGRLQALENTTPAATQLHQLMAEFSAEHCKNIAMEISSHALEQHRVTAELLDIAVFTNLSRDHLDYHHTMENYADAKYKIFSHHVGQVAILNGDDQQAKNWLNNWSSKQPVIVYGKSAAIAQYSAFVQASDIKPKANHVEFTLNTHRGCQQIESALIGDFNIDNLLAAIAVLLSKNISLTDIALAVKSLTPIIGRMESFHAENNATTIVDYAHTPDALVNALQACRSHCQGDLWVVFGCGGDRDKGKRPLMAQAAEKGADHLVFTSDNPRTEQVQDIINDMLAGCQKPEQVTVLADRELAVVATLTKAKPNDMILLAGKGHEDYIIIGDEKIAYNEREFVASIYRCYQYKTQVKQKVSRQPDDNFGAIS